MYTEIPHDINRPEFSFDDWWMSLDTWLDTPGGLAWLAEQSDVEQMRASAQQYGTRPGLEVCHHAR